MKNTVLIIAIAGLSFSSGAQEEFSLSIVGAPATIDATNGATITIDIIGDSTFGTHMFGGSFSMISRSDLINNIAWTPAGWSAFNLDGGYAGHGDYNLIVFDQLWHQGPAFPGSGLGMAIGSFQIQIGAGGVGVIDLSLISGPLFTLEAVEWSFTGFPGGPGHSMNDTKGNLTLNGASINVVPSMPSISVLAFAGLATSRRKRKTS